MHIIIHTFEDLITIIPFLFLAFLIIEFTEHKLSKKSKEKLENNSKFGPIIGSILGAIPQCGFSVLATNLYITRIISLGTLIAIYLSTSDEMLPILIAHNADIFVILKFILVKVIIGIFFGFIIDFIYKSKINFNYHICENDECHCHKSILKSSLIHTFKTFIFIFIITFVLNLIIHEIGEESLKKLLSSSSLFVPFISSLIGLIPNCASSIVITELYLNNVLSFASSLSGLLTSSGVALLVLFKTNKNIKENLKIVLILYLIGALVGFLLELINLI